MFISLLLLAHEATTQAQRPPCHGPVQYLKISESLWVGLDVAIILYV